MKRMILDSQGSYLAPFIKVAVSACLISFTPLIYSMDVVDTFSVEQTELVDLDPNPGLVSSSIGDGTELSILGGARDIAVDLLDNNGNNTRDATIVVNSGGQLDFSVDSLSNATGYVQWDGNDGSINLDLSGLGNTDLTNSGSNIAFLVDVVFSDADFEFVIEAYSSGTQWTKINFQANPHPTPETTTILFAGFTNPALCGATNIVTPFGTLNSIECSDDFGAAGGTNVVDFSSLNALQLIIDPDAKKVALDLVVDNIRLLRKSIDIEKLTNGNQADLPNDGDVPQIEIGDLVTWTYIVTNTGDTDFAKVDVIVTDDQGVTPVFVPLAGTDDGDDILEPGEIWHFTATQSAQNLVLNSDMNTVVDGCDPGSSSVPRNTYENIGRVEAEDVFDEDPSHYCNLIPGIDIEKLTNGNQADGSNDTDVPEIAVGDPVTWTYIVENTGETAYSFNEVIVEDDHFPGKTSVNDPVLFDFDETSDDGADLVLSPGEIWLYTVDGIAVDLNAVEAVDGITLVQGCATDTANLLTRKTYVNTATVTTVDLLTDFDPSHYCNTPDPLIDIEKLTNNNQADGANDVDVPVIAPGDSVIWTYQVTNIGNIPFTLAEVIVTDDQGEVPVFDATSDSFSDEILSPGEQWLYIVSSVAEDLMVNANDLSIEPGCDPSSTGITRDTYINNGKVVVPGAEDSDPSHYCNPEPGIDIEKLTNGHQADGANDADVPVIIQDALVTWTYIVTNTGLMPFNKADVSVTDDQGVIPVFVSGAGTDDGDNILAPGEVWHYQATLLQALDLATTTEIVTIVEGCSASNFGVPRETYENIGTVKVMGLTDSDPSHYCNPPEEEELLGCRVTAGLNDKFDTGEGINSYQAGGQAGAHTALQPQPAGEWTHHQKTGPAGAFTFHGGTASAPEGTEIDVIRCSDPGGCGPSGNPPSPVKQIDFDGIGTFKNIGKGAKTPTWNIAGATVTAEGHGNKDFAGTFHWFEVNQDDLGEVGNSNPKKNPLDDTDACPDDGFGEKGSIALAECACSDFYRITIYDGVNASDITKNADGSIPKDQMNTTDVIYEVWGYIDGGNLQIHSLTGFDNP